MEAPPGYDLGLVVRSHGWYDLAPWRWEAERAVLARPLLLSTGRAVVAEVTQPAAATTQPAAAKTQPAAATTQPAAATRQPAAAGALTFRALALGRLSAADAREARAAMAACLALDHDLADFHALARKLEQERAAGRPHLPDLRWALERGAGRLLRSPTVFEDAVKTLCTTNCSWSLTRVMVTRLCSALGAEAPAGERCFPTPAAMAAKGERFYRERIRAGYRAPFLLKLARSAASGKLDLEGMRGSAESTDALAERIGALDGFGPYATEHLLKLLGRFDHLALDSWVRGRLKALRGRRTAPTDRAVHRWYQPYGRWAGLAMWLEVTADWHRDRPGWP